MSKVFGFAPSTGSPLHYLYSLPVDRIVWSGHSGARLAYSWPGTIRRAGHLQERVPMPIFSSPGFTINS